MKVDPELDYAEAHFPDRWQVMGVKLLPFRAGHKIILQRVQSPFLTEGKDFSVADLVFALWVCSRPYKKARHYSDISLRWKVRAFFMAIRCKRNEELFNSRCEMFFKYLMDGQAQPKGPRHDSEAQRTYAPSLMILKRDLTRFTEDEFFELPLRQALFEHAGLAEKDGALNWPEDWRSGL